MHPSSVVVASLLVALALYSLQRFHQTSFVHPLSFELSPDLQHFRRANTSPFARQDVLPAFINYYENYRIAPAYNLATCQIQKSLSTLRAGIFCLLFDPEGFLAENKTISRQDWDNMHCGNSNEYFAIEAVEQLLEPSFRNFAVIRDPIDRFLSGFVDKCVNEADRGFCYGCRRDMRCFVERQLARFISFVGGGMDETASSFEDIHFAPQTWYCGFNKHLKSYEIVKYGKGLDIPRMSHHVLRILQDSGVEPKLLEIIQGEMMKGKTYHTTSGSTIRKQYENQLYSDNQLMRMVVQMYYFDFVVFGYPLPAQILEMQP